MRYTTEVEDGYVVVTDTKKQMDYAVQLAGGEYKCSLGCQITSDNEIVSSDLDEFDDIIYMAEKAAAEEFESSFEEQEIKFNCAIAGCWVIMRISLDDGSSELFIYDSAPGDYSQQYTETGLTFATPESAERWADQFRSENEYHDISGLNALMQELRGDGL